MIFNYSTLNQQTFMHRTVLSVKQEGGLVELITWLMSQGRKEESAWVQSLAQYYDGRQAAILEAQDKLNALSDAD